jgi:hypothetical protein
MHKNCLSCHNNAGKIHNLMTANKSFENVARLTIWEQQYKNCIHEEIKSRLNSGNACYCSLCIFCFPIFSLKTKGLKYTKP